MSFSVATAKSAVILLTDLPPPKLLLQLHHAVSGLVLGSLDSSYGAQYKTITALYLPWKKTNFMPLGVHSPLVSWTLHANRQRSFWSSGGVGFVDFRLSDKITLGG